jgi:hypothetical protein
VWVLCSVVACADAGAEGSMGGSSEASGGAETTNTMPTEPASTTGGTSEGGDASESSGTPTTTDPNDGSSSGIGEPAACELFTDFEGLEDDAPWPVPWVVTGGVAIADVVGGRGRLVPQTSDYSLARMFAPLPCDDVEGTLTFELTDASTQGAGFYVQHNGGYLDRTDPPGFGYAGFAESFREPAGIAVWREVDGHEQMLSPVTALAVQPNVVYRMRVRVTTQPDGAKLVQARVWPDAEVEPTAWQAEAVDAESTAIDGGVVLDAWSSLVDGDAFAIYFDDVELRPVPAD